MYAPGKELYLTQVASPSVQGKPTCHEPDSPRCGLSSEQPGRPVEILNRVQHDSVLCKAQLGVFSA